MVLAGELDPIRPVAIQQALLDHLPAHLVRFELIPECGGGTYRDQPERTMTVLREFLVECSRALFASAEGRGGR